MLNEAARDAIESAIRTVKDASSQPTGGKWLEDVTVRVARHIAEWDIKDCYLWKDWPERERHFPGTTNRDVGIDAVAIRRSDGKYVAIQCKSRQLDENGRGHSISKGEVDSFASASAGTFWADRWIVTNGDVDFSANVKQNLSMHDKSITPVNISYELQQARASQSGDSDEACPHCSRRRGLGNDGEHENNEYKSNRDDDEKPIQTKSCMQNEAVTASVRILKEHAESDSGGSPMGQARGKIILPCGTGKTRISLRIVEQLTSPGELAIVLCPSIALVAQLRREYLQYTKIGIRALAVCSDETAGYDPKKEGSRNTTTDPTADSSNVSASAVKGSVTTDAREIAQWIRQGAFKNEINVIFGTYQSGHRVAEAMKLCRARAKTLIADEAHRTAGLRRKKNSRSTKVYKDEKRIRDFTLCHDNDAFPAKYRIYQTATPRIYDTRKVNKEMPSDWIVRSMDDEETFGVELYRKSYLEAVRNSWLADYRIIAIGVNDADAYAAANKAASDYSGAGRNQLTSNDYLRGLALALVMGGATQGSEQRTVNIKSCIAFMNTVNKSKNMAMGLQSKTVRDWIQKWLEENADAPQRAANYSMQHLDATSNVTAREQAKLRLAQAKAEKPFSIINVGIFGEGTDSPSLNAVAFLEPRKSPIDVVQAVGRAMRTAPGKKLGYIICPVLIPPHSDPEHFLSTTDMADGWQELGQILLALRAHDSRIEDELADLLQLYIPEPPEHIRSIVAVAKNEDKRIQYREHIGKPGDAEKALDRVLQDKSTPTKEFSRLAETPATYETVTSSTPTALLSGKSMANEAQAPEHSQILTGKINQDGSSEMRTSSVVRTKPLKDGAPGPIDFRKTKRKAKAMINKGEGLRTSAGRKPRQPSKNQTEKSGIQMLMLSQLSEHGNAIRMNLLAKSGLVSDRVTRDLNILEDSIKEAAHNLRMDGLSTALDAHFGLDNLSAKDANRQADGCTIAALLMMNAAMLHQRIAAGRWISGIADLAQIKNSVNVVRGLSRQWERILREDFRPVLEPALETIYAAEETGKTSGLERALRHITAEAERIAEAYADMGADHAGPLFNGVMGNQASDGAFFTRPPAASIAARLTLDACGDVDWTSEDVWREHKTVDLACGSGTLLSAMLTEMKRRASQQGASDEQVADLQKVAVEETIKGLDINPVSLQLAASQLTAGNREIRYRNMGLYQMPYGPHRDDPRRVSAGTLELLGQKSVITREGELDIPDEEIDAQATWDRNAQDAELEDAVAAAKDARIVIMNPPFTNRANMGQKFAKDIQLKLRKRADAMENMLVRADQEMNGFVDKNSIGPMFVAFADHCVDECQGVLTMIEPTVSLCSTSIQNKREILSQRFHIHTILTCHQPGQVNLSQNAGINESIIVATRRDSVTPPPTKFVNLDRFPRNEEEVADLHECLLKCNDGQLANGWGEVLKWPAELMERGDWTAAIWRSPELARASRKFANHAKMQELQATPASWIVHATGRVLRGHFRRVIPGTLNSFPIIKSKGSHGQTSIRSTPDEHWIPKKLGTNATEKVLQKSGYLLITDGQNNSTARLTAVADEKTYVGNGWMPVAGISVIEAKAAAVFINSTAGRLQLMRNPGRTLVFPIYSAAEIGNLKLPYIRDARIRGILAACWERTKDMLVPQFRDGECEVRRLWDEAVAEAMNWDADYLSHLRHLLHREPHVRGLGYNQYADE